MSKRVLFALAALATVFGLTLWSPTGSRTAHAQTTWVGDTSQDWSDATNWSSDPAAPTGNFLVNTDAVGVFPIYSGGPSFAPVDIFIANTAASTGRLDQTAGNLATGGPNWLRMGEGGGSTGTFNLSGGTFTGRVHMARVGTVAGTATINVSGTGTLSSPGELVVSDGQNNTATAQGTLNMTDSAIVNSEGDLLIAFAGGANSFGEVNIGAGTTYNLATTIKRWLIVNQWDTTQGRLNVSGTLNLNAVTDLRFSIGNGTGTSAVTLNPGGAINMQAGSELDFNQGSNVNVNNTFNLDGGVITVGRVMRNNGGAGGTRVFNFNGGTLRAAGAAANFFDADTATLADVKAGGAVIDSNTFDISMGQALSGVGGLTKNGDGILTLTGISTYAGDTTVNAGTLALADNAGLSFIIGASGVNNTVTGSGAAALDGDFTFDLTGASTTQGASWSIVNVGTLAETFGSTFSVNSFTDAGGNLWTQPIGGGLSYQFSESTGVLQVVPEPGAALLLGGLSLLGLRRRRASAAA
jgi:autotransporter-associated beta strand protein